MGYYVYMDDNGDVEGNYSLVALCDVNTWRKSMHSVNLKNGENERETTTPNGLKQDDQRIF